MELRRALARESLPRLLGDPLGLAVQRVALDPVRVPAGAVEVPLFLVELRGWWADRCAVELFNAVSRSGGELRVRLVAANRCGEDPPAAPAFVQAADRGVTLAAGVPRSLSAYTASGPLGDYWCVLGRMLDPAHDCELSASLTLDRAGAGHYVAAGEGTKV